MIALVAAAAVTAELVRVVEQIDPIDDKKAVYATVGDAKHHLAVGCDDVSDRSSIRVVVHFNRRIGYARPGILRGGAELQYRFDRRPPRTVFWYAHNREVRAETQGTLPMRFILGMKDTSKVYLRTFNYRNDPVEMQFAYTGATPAIEDVLARCGFDARGAVPGPAKAVRRR